MENIPDVFDVFGLGMQSIDVTIYHVYIWNATTLQIQQNEALSYVLLHGHLHRCILPSFYF